MKNKIEYEPPKLFVIHNEQAPGADCFPGSGAIGGCWSGPAATDVCDDGASGAPFCSPGSGGYTP